jgi:spore maturation protein CgeB
VRIFVEGPWWAGRWTDISVATLEQLGHETACYYHNRKTPADRLRLAGGRLAQLTGRQSPGWPALARRHLMQRLASFRPDLLISIQGKLDASTARQLKQRLPGVKIVFWWGDILTVQGLQKIEQAAAFADHILVSYRGIHEELAPRYGEQLLYFPFAASPRFHSPGNMTSTARDRLAAEVAFVGTCYPERCELIRYLNARLDRPVRVWGRGWRRCRGVRSHGPLSLADSIRVYAHAAVTLNLHHRDTDNGCNMKFYEIPAAGGYQVCDWQPVLQESALGRLTTACRTPEEFLDRIRHALQHPGERTAAAARARAEVLTNEAWETRFKKLLKRLC